MDCYNANLFKHPTFKWQQTRKRFQAPISAHLATRKQKQMSKLELWAWRWVFSSDWSSQRSVGSWQGVPQQSSATTNFTRLTVKWEVFKGVRRIPLHYSCITCFHTVFKQKQCCSYVALQSLICVPCHATTLLYSFLCISQKGSECNTCPRLSGGRKVTLFVTNFFSVLRNHVLSTELI